MTESPICALDTQEPVRGLLLLRHGATQWSREGRHTGRTDLPLLPDGVAEAAAAASLIAAQPISAIYSSPLRRAAATAAALDLGLPIEHTDALLEWDYGEYEGLTTEEIRATRPDWDLFRDGCPGGESPAAIAARVAGFLDRLTFALDAPGFALAVAHGHVLRVLATSYAGLDIEVGRQLDLGAAHLCALGEGRDARVIAAWNVPPRL